MPNHINYRKSISEELISTKDRVRNFIDNRHWGEDGRYKEIILSEKEWQYYIDETNSLFNNKLIEIRNSHTELTPPDMIVISMICLGVDISDTCQVLNMTKNTMYSRRKKIKKRLNIDVEDDLEEWIRLNIKSFAA